MGDVGGALSFYEYDLTAVRVSSIFPRGAPTSTLTQITLRGSGFAEYGEGQLICEVSHSSSGSKTRMQATLLSTGDSILCPYQSPSSPVSNLSISLSLNNGTAGTFSPDVHPFVVYQHAVLTGVFPAEGDANGGNMVTIFGSGFTALSSDIDHTRETLRCKFGPTVQTLAPTWMNATAVSCMTTWGVENPDGLPVAIALNGQSFDTSGDAVRYVFKGLHKPALLEAYFPTAAASIIIRFDPQPTNRAGMNGVGPCSQVLDDATILQLQGTSKDAPKCAWLDDVTLEAKLDLYTSAVPGMTIGLRANRIWPKAWAYPGSCMHWIPCAQQMPL